MKLACRKCNHILTKDLYPHHKWAMWGSAFWICDEGWVSYEHNGEIHRHDENADYHIKICGHKTEPDLKYSIQEGTFMELNTGRPNAFHHGFVERYYLNRDDCIGMTFIPFREGLGCCDNSGIEVKCGECATTIGYEHYDCYDDHHVDVPKTKTIRKFG